MEQHEEAWILTDGNAGNLRQARALAAALGLTPKEWTLQARKPWRWLAPRWLPFARHAFGPEFMQALKQPPRLAIGCGRQAALATRLARRGGAKAVQILHPRIRTKHWDLVITPEHDQLVGRNVITMVGSLNPVDDAWLEAGRQAFPHFGDFPRPRAALLIGGPTENAPYHLGLLHTWIEDVMHRLTKCQGSVLATTSRRTPPTIGPAVRFRMERRVNGMAWCAGDAEPNPYAGILGWADVIFCTPDSVNMLSEAAATRCPVVVMGAPVTNGRLRRFLSRLIMGGRAYNGLKPEIQDTHEPLRETARVAAEVRARLQLPEAAPSPRDPAGHPAGAPAGDRGDASEGDSGTVAG